MTKTASSAVSGPQQVALFRYQLIYPALDPGQSTKARARSCGRSPPATLHERALLVLSRPACYARHGLVKARVGDVSRQTRVYAREIRHDESLQRRYRGCTTVFWP
jgi:hypothetical protein